MFKFVWLAIGLILLIFNVQAMVTTTQSCQNPLSLIVEYPAEELNAEETSKLLYLRSVEKMAYDIYVSLADRWQLPMLFKMKQGESIHQAFITTLLAKYQLADPYATHSTRGVYQEQDLDKLFSQLLPQSLQSFSKTLAVIATIEEFEIHKLQEALATTDSQDVKFLYQNLLKDARNHLRTSINTLRNKDQTYNYSPQYLTTDEFNQIVNAPKERGWIYNDKGEAMTKLCPVQPRGDASNRWKDDDYQEHRRYDDDDYRGYRKYDDDDDLSGTPEI